MNLRKAKTRIKQSECIHVLRYEKWVHEGPKQGKSFHFKEACDLCGLRRCVPRTKDIFEAVRDQKWRHSKRKKPKSLLEGKEN